MTPLSANLDWLYHAGGIVLASLAALLLLWSHFWDRARGRLRCPKCWYAQVAPPESRGTHAARSEPDGAEATDSPEQPNSPPASPSSLRRSVASSLPTTCPECAKRITKPRQLCKTRRRWRLALVATLMLLASPLIAAYPHRADLYIARMMPTWVLLKLLPLSEVPPQNNLAVISHFVTSGLRDDAQFVSHMRQTFVSPLPLRQQIQAELLFDRLNRRGALTESQWRSVIDICVEREWVHFLSHCLAICELPPSIARETVIGAAAREGVTVCAVRDRGRWEVWARVPALLGTMPNGILIIRPAHAPDSIRHFRERIPTSAARGWIWSRSVNLHPQSFAPPPDSDAKRLPFLVSLQDASGNVLWSDTIEAEVVHAD